MAKRIICPNCRSEAVEFHSWVEWDVKNQRWNVTNVEDYGHCISCDYDVSPKEVPILNKNIEIL